MFSALREKKTNQLNLTLTELVTWKDDPISDLLSQLAENQRKLPKRISTILRLLYGPEMQVNEEGTQSYASGN